MMLRLWFFGIDGMGVWIIDGVVIVCWLMCDVVGQVEMFMVEWGVVLGLVVVLVGIDLVSEVYVRWKVVQIVVVGICLLEYCLLFEMSQLVLLDFIVRLNDDFEVYGIFVQLLFFF